MIRNHFWIFSLLETFSVSSVLSTHKPLRSSEVREIKEDDDEVEIIEADEAVVEDEDEDELLVDDFDGECCRTYPFNHSKILRL